MTWNPYPPLPMGAIRDLLGITRALYRHTVQHDPKDVVRLQALADIGRGLRYALRAGRAHPGTVDHVQAWAAAERATRALGELVEGELSPVVETTAQGILGVRKTMA